MAKKQAYKIDRTKKTITIDTTVKQSINDEKEIAMYVSAGYVIKHKSLAKAKQAKERSDSITAADIRNELANDKEALKEFNRLMSNGGFFTARKYYNSYLEQQKPKRGRKTATAEAEA